jgi:hypothetical protein
LCKEPVKKMEHVFDVDKTPFECKVGKINIP